MEQKKYTAADIEELKKKDPSELTSYERGLANLRPNKKGETGEKHLGSRKKGTPNWSTYFKRLMADEAFLNTIITSLPKKWEGVVEKYPASVIAAGLIASATQNVAKAIVEGKPIDKATLEMIDRISKIGYGDKVGVEVGTEEGFFDKVTFNFVTKEDRPQPEES